LWLCGCVCAWRGEEEAKKKRGGAIVVKQSFISEQIVSEQA
jgi:hypothetical protein